MGTAAFHDDGLAIQQAITDDSLTALFAIRNLIAHRAGRCDAKYLGYATKMPSIPQLKHGEMLQLNGSIMRQTLPPALNCCVRLVHEVDTWLLTHP
jgi:hypothetical protein